ncbi:MAG: isoaspartyl peptidase/L-asparaginase, partial [Chloroflexota bacterium]
TPLKPAGRIGDTPIFGAGGYADKGYGGAAATGRGEHAMRLMLSRYVVDAIQAGKTANEAAQDAIQHAEARIPNSMLGTIVVDTQGNIGAAHSTPKLACGWIDVDGNPQVTMRGGVVQKATE